MPSYDFRTFASERGVVWGCTQNIMTECNHSQTQRGGSIPGEFVEGRVTSLWRCFREIFGETIFGKWLQSSSVTGVGRVRKKNPLKGLGCDAASSSFDSVQQLCVTSLWPSHFLSLWAWNHLGLTGRQATSKNRGDDKEKHQLLWRLGSSLYSNTRLSLSLF